MMTYTCTTRSKVLKPPGVLSFGTLLRTRQQRVVLILVTNAMCTDDWFRLYEAELVSTEKSLSLPTLINHVATDTLRVIRAVH
jgi:hypothetical protein